MKLLFIKLDIVKPPTSFLSKQRGQNKTLYVENSVDSSTEDVYWLSSHIVWVQEEDNNASTMWTSCVLAQQENKG
jgi:hypothetical protein